MFYKFLVAISILGFITNSVRPQANKLYKKDSLEINECPIDTIDLHDGELTNNHQPLIKLPFSQVLFKDVRFDTSYIGGANTRKYLFSNGYHKLRFNVSAKDAISGFFYDSASYTFNTGNYKLLCFIKKFRVTQIDSILNRNKAKKLYTTATIEIEAFLESNDLYHPALRLDTLASSFSVKLKDISILKDLLRAFADEAAHIDTLNVLKRKAYSYSEITDRYEKRFNEPIIKDSILNKGVYKTAEEFLTNNPSVKYFEFNKQGILYTRIENGEIVPTREVFGFCDGERVWINIHNFFRPLIRQGNTFEFLADMNLLNEIRPAKTTYIFQNHNETVGEALATGAAIALVALLSANKSSSEFVYQLDIQTAQFY